MRVILELGQKYLDRFEALAVKDNRSRKNFMETVLMNFIDGSPPTLERQNVPRDTLVDNSARIQELEDELKILPDTALANGRKKWIKQEIYKLKYPAP